MDKHSYHQFFLLILHERPIHNKFQIYLEGLRKINYKSNLSKKRKFPLIEVDIV